MCCSCVDVGEAREEDFCALSSVYVLLDETFLRNAPSRDLADLFPRRWTHYSNMRNFRELSAFTLSLYQIKTLQTQNNQPHNHNMMEYGKINSDWLQTLLTEQAIRC